MTKLNERIRAELKKYEEAETSIYNYKVKGDKVYRIKKMHLGTTAALTDKSPYNPYGWEYICDYNVL